MPRLPELVAEAAALAGIGAGYTDVFGHSVATPLESRAALLAGFGLPVDDEAAAAESLRRLRRLRQGLVPALLPVAADAAAGIDAAAGAEWNLAAEAGPEVAAGRAADGMLQLPPLPPGYYRLAVRAGGEEAAATVIAAPERCYHPEALAGGGRIWGLTAPVYGLRGGADLGIGDFGAVAEAATAGGRAGAAFLGLSPVHALFAAHRGKISPYSPSSRLFIEPLFIDPTSVEGFSGSVAAALYESPDYRAAAAALAAAPLVDHAAAWALKLPLLELLWAAERQRSGRALAAFRAERGEALERHAAFEALSLHFRAEGRGWPGEWPEEYRDAASPAVARFRADHADAVAFHAWLQWLAERQLAAANRRARAAGMAIGLYRDLAVGADRGGSEVWSAPERFAATLSVGAPPDLLAPQGQDWGLPPLNPLALAEDGLAAFRALVEANMRHAGAIRIDHAFQLRRLYAIPLGEPSSRGAYVEYPLAAMLAVLRLESHRARCLVIGEDLGTAPERFSEAIMASGVLSYRVVYFETADGRFKPPAAYPREALSVITTHDLPTFAGWWRGLEIDLRQTLGLFDPDTAEGERRRRAADRQALADALAGEGLLPPGPAPPEPPFEATVRYLARTPAMLAAVQIEDVLGELNQANMPGTGDEAHPNWRRRVHGDLAALDAPGGPLARVAAAFAAEGRGGAGRAGALVPPRATYRMQFHAGFTFDDAAAAVPYLAALGVSHLYASPIHAARPGSTHGYDIVDHARINPELGGEEGFARLGAALAEHGLKLILDIVPNHMAVGGADNRWWLSVLEWGELSPHAAAFDIDWQRLGAGGKLVVPFLGDSYGEVLEKGELKLAFDPAEGSFSVWHFEHRLPVSPLTYPAILDRALATLGGIEGAAAADLLSVAERLRTMAGEPEERRAAFPEEAEALKRRIAAAVAEAPGLGEAIGRAVALIDGVPGMPESFGTLHRLLEAQAYRPAHWRIAASDINYRRFFDINSLAGLRVELPEVFAATHEMVFRLVAEGRVDGLRIDHIDGLADPAAYCAALERAVGPGRYVVAEKILEPGEAMRPWPIAGTTGYDLLNLVDGLFVDGDAAGRFDALYRTHGGSAEPYGVELREVKAEVLESSFASELEVLVSDLKRIADADRRTRDFTAYAIRRALIEIVARFPVYRSYLTGDEPEVEDLRLVEMTVARARRASRMPDSTVHDFVADTLLGRGADPSGLALRFRRRFQQLTGPVMAKSLEDTLFYRYVRLLGLNEVGGDPGRFGVSPAAFHATIAARAAAWPHAMNASATHDTKRGEDARGRLLALSEVPDLWAEAVAAWERLAAAHVAFLEGEAAPDANDRLMILQSLLGAWPMELLGGDDGADGIVPEDFPARLEGWLEKALREGKRRSSWVNPDAAYEEAARRMLRALLEPGAGALAALRPLARRLALAGAVDGLARIVLKLTLPGVPDLYQGTELWDLALVDPDNRRPVDYAARRAALAEAGDPGALLADWPTGRIKLRILAALLADRAAAPELYARGDYRPLQATGAAAPHILAFARAHGGERLAVAVPRLPLKLAGGVMPTGAVWGEAAVALPPGAWRDMITGRRFQAGGPAAAAELFATLPVAVLRTSG